MRGGLTEWAIGIGIYLAGFTIACWIYRRFGIDRYWDGDSYGDADPTMAIFFGVFWPLWTAIVIVIAPLYGLYRLADSAVKERR